MIPGEPGQLRPVRTESWRRIKIIAFDQDRTVIVAGFEVYTDDRIDCFGIRAACDLPGRKSAGRVPGPYMHRRSARRPVLSVPAARRPVHPDGKAFDRQSLKNRQTLG